MYAWPDGGPMRLRELEAGKDDPDPKALACYGVPRGDTGGMRLRFVEGRPVGRVAEGFLAWACEALARGGKEALLLIWGNASRRAGRRVRAWIEAHTRRARGEGGVRIVACRLPIKAPWLNRIEPRWVHGGRAIIEPDRKLTGDEIIERVCGYYGCERLDRLKQEVP